jgi:hypothetical protein
VTFRGRHPDGHPRLHPQANRYPDKGHLEVSAFTVGGVPFRQIRVHIDRISGKAAIVRRPSTKDKIRFMSSSHEAPPATLDCALEVGPDD